MPPDEPQVITVRIRRGAGGESWIAEYQVPVEAGESVLGALQYIYDHLDPTLSFACSCRIGLCSACLVRINGKVAKACTTLADGDVLVEPYKDAARIRDLAAHLPSLVG